MQGGLGAASSNAVATMFGVERELGTHARCRRTVRIAAEVGSDLPLFLIGGTVLGVDRGQEVYPLQDLPPMHLVMITPPVGVSTPQAFADWDALVAREAELTHCRSRGYNKTVRQRGVCVAEQGFPIRRWACIRCSRQWAGIGPRHRFSTSSEPGSKTTLNESSFLSIPSCVRRNVLLEREGARYASLSGSGSTLYGIFELRKAQTGGRRISAAGHAAVATTTLTREAYWTAVVGRRRK